MLCQSSDALLKMSLRTFQAAVSVLMTPLFLENQMKSIWKTFIELLTRLPADCGLKLNPDKFFLVLDKVEYLGTAAGISRTAEKVQAIKEAAPPTNVSELQSFLGSANFRRKFVPDFAKLASSLYGLLCKEVPWRWSKLERTLLITSRLL